MSSCHNDQTKHLRYLGYELYDLNYKLHRGEAPFFISRIYASAHNFTGILSEQRAAWLQFNSAYIKL